MTDHEYGALVELGMHGVKAKIHIKYANVTLPLESKDKFFIFQVRFHQKQKFISFSNHESNWFSISIKDIIDFAKERKIITIVDGAHVPGHIDLHIHNLGCDFYTGALHKWMCGQKEFLYLLRTPKWIKPLIYSW